MLVFGCLCDDDDDDDDVIILTDKLYVLNVCLSVDTRLSMTRRSVKTFPFVHEDEKL